MLTEGLKQYLPQVQAALKRIPTGAWREFAAFDGPELSQLTAWENKVVLVGDSSHALSGAFGSGSGFAMEDGWILAQALVYYQYDLSKALPLFDAIRVPYYRRMYAHLEDVTRRQKDGAEALGNPSEEDKVRLKVKGARKDMRWIYENNIGKVWEEAIGTLDENR
jgi:salicylate hydroxylase